jgi:hypothetical protein
MNAPLDKLADQAFIAAAQNGQLVLLNEVLKWAGKHRDSISVKAREELLQLAARYS